MNALTAAAVLGLTPAAAKDSHVTNAVAAAVSGAIAANALAHLVQLAVFRTYNPGLCSAVTLLLPAGVLSLRELHRRGRDPLPAAAIGAVLSGPATFLSLVAAKRLML